MQTETREAYIEKIEAQLKEWNAKIDLLKARTDKAEASVKVEVRKKIEDLQARREAVRAKLDELKGASEEAMESLRSGVQKAFQDLRSAVESAVGQFK